MRSSLLVLAAVSAWAFLSAGPAAAAIDCLRVGDVYTFHVRDNRTVIVEDRRHNKFKVDLMAICPQLKFKFGLGFKSLGGTTLSCLGPGDYVLARDRAMGPDRCPISKVTAYTPAMEKADKAREKAAHPSP
jgi:hypothetical protein